MISTFTILVFGAYGILNELNEKQEKAEFDAFARGWVEGYEGRGQYEVLFTIVYDSLDPKVGYLAYSLKDGKDIAYLSEFNRINDKWWNYMGNSTYEGKEQDFRNPKIKDVSELSISSLLE